MSDNKLTQTDVSLNPPATDLVNIKINGVALQVPKGENLIESARRIGIDVPYFCYHPRLSKGDAANCRMCLVDVSNTGPDGSVRKMPKPQTACTMPAAEGMVIETESESVVRDRKGILEFLLINHPLDCPVCDRGGECPLQNNALFYGPPTTRYIEEKRHLPKAYPLSEHVVFDRERCIHCARCTRFTEDISGDVQLGFLKRGADMEVGTFAHTSYSSKFSGNVIELCPVGALLSRNYRFKARPWDILTQRSVCSRCSNGCNIKFDYRVDQIQRVMARLNEDVNEEWTCDRGKFGHEYISSEKRLRQPLVKRDGKWRPIDWNEAYRILTTKLKDAGSRVGGIGGARCTNEDNYAFQKLFRETLKSGNLDHRLCRYQGPSAKPILDRLGYHSMGNSIAELESMKTILVLGSELAAEQPIIFLRVRKACRFKGAAVVNALNRSVEDTTNAGDFAAANLQYRPGSELALINGIINSLFTQKLADTASNSEFKAILQSVISFTPEKTAAETGISTSDISTAAALLAKGPMAIIAGESVTGHPLYSDIAAALCNLAILTGNSGNLNIPGRECNTQGASDMGVLPDSGPGYSPVQSPGMNTDEMLKAAGSGDLKVLWIMGADLINGYSDHALAERALENCPFIVINELSLTETASMADLILPVASMAEKDGTYTSCERRIQRIYRAFDVDSNMKTDWQIFSEVGELMGSVSTFVTARDVWQELTSNAASYAGITLKSLGDAGIRWQYPAAATKSPLETAVEHQAPGSTQDNNNAGAVGLHDNGAIMPSILNDLLHGIFPDYVHAAGMQIHIPELVPYVALVGIIGFILGIVPGLIWIERVVIALMQDRSGPNRVGPRGLLQTLADGVKLFFKEEIRPRSVDVRIYYLAPVIAMIPALAGGGTLPLQILHFRSVADGHLFTVPLSVGDVNIGLLYILALSSLQVYGVVLAGWASNNKYSLLGGLRASAQLISYELAMGLSLLCVVVMAGSLRLSDVVAAQNVLPLPGAPEVLRGGILSWYWIQSGFVPFLIYTIAMIAETNRAPFDLPEAESELIAGFHTEYSSMKFAMFFMGEYASMLTVCGLNAAMFWGGSLPPLNIAPINLVPGFIWFILKVMLGILFYVWLRATLPRLRYDALMNLGWKRLLPVGLIWLLVLAGYNLVRYPHNEGDAARVVMPSNYIDIPELFSPNPSRSQSPEGQTAPSVNARPVPVPRRNAVSNTVQPGDTPSGAPNPGLNKLRDSNPTGKPDEPAPLDTIEAPTSAGSTKNRSVAPMPVTPPGAQDAPGDRTHLSVPETSGYTPGAGASGQ